LIFSGKKTEEEIDIEKAAAAREKIKKLNYHPTKVPDAWMEQLEPDDGMFNTSIATIENHLLNTQIRWKFCRLCS